MAKFRQGLFKPTNPLKYIGNTEHIVYRSFLEFRVMSKLDNDPSIVKWASEEFFVPYKSPVDNRTHRYFVDLFFEKKENGKTQKYLCEVKPYEQCGPPKSKGRKLIVESARLLVNLAKWSAASEWAKKRNAKFIIWTEKDLDGK